MHLDELIAKSRAHGRVFMNGSNFFLKTDEIVIEYDYEFELLSRIRREGAKALSANNAKFLTDILLRSPCWIWKRSSQRWSNTAMASKVSSMASAWMYGHERIIPNGTSAGRPLLEKDARDHQVSHPSKADQCIISSYQGAAPKGERGWSRLFADRLNGSG